MIHWQTCDASTWNPTAQQLSTELSNYSRAVKQKMVTSNWATQHNNYKLTGTAATLSRMEHLIPYTFSAHFQLQPHTSKNATQLETSTASEKKLYEWQFRKLTWNKKTQACNVWEQICGLTVFTPLITALQGHNFHFHGQEIHNCWEFLYGQHDDCVE